MIAKKTKGAGRGAQMCVEGRAGEPPARQPQGGGREDTAPPSATGMGRPTPTNAGTQRTGVIPVWFR